MSDADITNEEQVSEEDRTPNGTVRLILTIVLVVLVILLLAVFSTAAYYEVSPEDVKLITRNAKCVTCHTEVVAELRMKSMHPPYENEHCTDCHLQHGNLTKDQLTKLTASGTVTTKTWLRWGPFRWLISSIQDTFGIARGSVDRTRIEQIGQAGLIMPGNELCWTCHGNLRADRRLPFRHSPFAKSHCLSCHNPHASENAPLLRASEDQLCMTCHPMGRELGRAQAHRPVEQRQCTVCHKAHSSEFPGLLVASQRDLCFTCHPSVATLSNMAVQHQPFDENNCTGCHEPHGSDYEPLLIAQTPKLCNDCHTGIASRVANEESHHPIGTQIDCTSCHQPHASDFRGLLVEQERELCTTCHDDIANLQAKPVQHEPYAEDPCTSCHVPHGSKYSPLLRNPQPNLCFRCHDDIAQAYGQVSHHADDCSGCHEVHAGDYSNLLVGAVNRQFCFRCHPSINKFYASSKHDPIECLSCHVPHGSRWGSLLSQKQPDVCSRCHQPTDHIRFVGNGDSAHRATPRFYDVHAKKPLSCSSTCHNPHGSKFAFMIRRWGTQPGVTDPDLLPVAVEDGVCLDCHPGVSKRY